MTRARSIVVWSAWAALCVARIGPPPIRAQALQNGWTQAEAGYRFAFPRDHASHPEYKIEWWYYTGNLRAVDGRRFGYQLTFFRIGIVPQPANPSAWAVRDLFMTHLALTEIDAGRFRFRDRFNRAAVGWAGADTARYRVWNEDWEARLAPNGSHRLRASVPEFGLDLTLDPGKTPVVHGSRGISQKGSQPGNATHYYSMTRMPTRGKLRVNGADLEVDGLSWMDHEFGTSFLEPSQAGWDWFSIQLDDRTELMLFELRRSDGTIDPHSSGTLIDATGQTRPIGAEDFRLTPGTRWTAQSGAKYPSSWQIRVPGQGIDLQVQPAVLDQELRLGVKYWEGAIAISGQKDGRPVHGRGYLEMTGYAGPPLGALFR